MGAYVAAELRRRVRDRYKDCCAYCRSAERLTVSAFEVEHILPRSAGGATAFENLCLACPTCNRHKSDRTTVIDPGSQQETPLFHPYNEYWEEHFVWNRDATEIGDLSITGRATIHALRMNRPQLIRVRRMWVVLGEHPPEFSE